MTSRGPACGVEHPRPPTSAEAAPSNHPFSLYRVNSWSFPCATRPGIFLVSVVTVTALVTMTSPQPVLSIFWGQPQGQVGMDETMSKPFLRDTWDLGWQFGLCLKPSCRTGTHCSGGQWGQTCHVMENPSCLSLGESWKMPCWV